MERNLEEIQFTPLKLHGKTVNIRLIRSSDRESLVRLLEEHFFTDDPCDAALLRACGEAHGEEEVRSIFNNVFNKCSLCSSNIRVLVFKLIF